jgi:acyl carrier protein
LRKTVSEADLKTLSPDENLRKALDIDSFDFLNFIIALNDALGVSIPESDYGKLNTLSAMVSYLSERIS